MATQDEKIVAAVKAATEKLQEDFAKKEADYQSQIKEVTEKIAAAEASLLEAAKTIAEKDSEIARIEEACKAGSTPDKKSAQAKTGTILICVNPCQVSANGKILTFEKEQVFTVTEDCIYPAKCFKEK